MLHGRNKKFWCVIYCMFLTLLLFVQPVYAYIGPGAGFAFLTTFMYFFIAFFLAVFYLLTWPIRYIIRFFRMRKIFRSSRVNRVIIVGLDGMDPDLAEKYMKEE